MSHQDRLDIEQRIHRWMRSNSSNGGHFESLKDILDDFERLITTNRKEQQ